MWDGKGWERGEMWNVGPVCVVMFVEIVGLDSKTVQLLVLGYRKNCIDLARMGTCLFISED